MRKINKKEVIRQAIPILGLTILILLALTAYHLKIFTSVQSLRSFISQFGEFAVIIFILIQLIQVIVPILPGGISTLVGMLMFGNLPGLFYSYIGLVLGEILVFLLVRNYGTSFIKIILSEKKFIKFQSMIGKQNQNIKKLLVGTLLIPFAPDDLVCLVAGLSAISFKDFLWIILLFKPWSIGIYGYILLFLFERAQQL